MSTVAANQARRLCRTAIPPLVSLAAGCCLLLPGEGFWALIAVFMLLPATIARVTAVKVNKVDSDLAAASLTESRQFTIGELMFAVLFVALILAAVRLLGPERSAGLLLWLPASWLLWGAIAEPARAASALLMLHLVLAAYLAAGPIMAYHVNGRAFYDYGLSGWNPPLSQNDSGKTYRGDYDPKFTPPATWPTIGPTIYAMCWYSMSVAFCPPTAPLVAFVTLVLLCGERTRRLKPLLIIWALGALPLGYLLVWGRNVGAWIVD